MKASKREQLKAKKQAYVQDAIIDSAVELFAQRGFSSVTIDDIASNLGYTKSVVYYYFESKNEILWNIFSRIWDSYFTEISSIIEKKLPPEDALKEMIRTHAMLVMQQRNWTAIYNREESELDNKQRELHRKRLHEYAAFFTERYDEGVKNGLFRDIPAHVAVNGLLGMCNSLCKWYSDKGSISAEQIAQYYVDILSRGYMINAKD